MLYEVSKLFKAEQCGKVLELAQSLRIIDFFRLGIDEENKFHQGMTKAISIMKSLDIFLSNIKLNIFIKEKHMKKSVRKLLHERTKALVIPFAFYPLDQNYSRNFAKEFIFSTSSNDFIGDYLHVIEILSSRTLASAKRPQDIIECIIDQTNFDDFKFQLNLIFYASVLEKKFDIDDFIDYYVAKAKHHFYEFMAKDLNL